LKTTRTGQGKGGRAQSGLKVNGFPPPNWRTTRAERAYRLVEPRGHGPVDCIATSEPCIVLLQSALSMFGGLLQG
jgi:hypothetical protein